MVTGSLGSIDLVPKSDAEQLSMFIDNERRERRERLKDTIEVLRSRFGKKLPTRSCWVTSRCRETGGTRSRCPG